MIEVQQAGKTWPIYTENEAKEANIPYKYWKECKSGEFGLSDDTYVAECRRVSLTKTGDSRHFYPKASAWRKHGKLYLVNKPEFDWAAREARQSRVKRMVKVYTKMVMAGKIDWDMLGRVYRPDQKCPAATVRRLLKQEKIDKMVDKEIDKVLAEEGLDSRWVINKLKRAIEMAETTKDPNAMIRGAVEAAKLRDMYPKEKKQTTMLEFSMTKELGDAMARATEELRDVEVLPSHEDQINEV